MVDCYSSCCHHGIVSKPNVLDDPLQLLLWLTLLLRGALGLCTEDIFTAYLYMHSGSNATVGFIQVTNGLLGRLPLQLLM